MPHRFIVFSGFTLGLILLFTSAWADLGMKLDFERRSVLVQVQGSSQVAPGGDMQKARTEALENAKIEALKQAGQWYEARYAAAKAKPVWPVDPKEVSVIAIVDLGMDKGEYTLQVRAEVPFQLVKSPGMEPNGPLSVILGIAIEEGEKKQGITMTLSGNKNFFGRLVLLLDNGQAVQLLPNVQRQQELFQAGKEYKIPDSQDGFSLSSSKGGSQDSFVLLSASGPLGPVEFTSTDSGLLLLPEGVGTLLQQSRHGALCDMSKSKPGGVEIYEAHWSIVPPESGSQPKGKVPSRGVRLEDPEGPIDMTGSAGAHEPLKLPAIQ